MALTAEHQKALDDLGKMWNTAKTQQEKDNIHNWANSIRNADGMQAGTDYDPVSGARLNSGSSTPASSSGGTNMSQFDGGQGVNNVPYYKSLPVGFKYTPQPTPAAQQLGDRIMAGVPGYTPQATPAPAPTPAAPAPAPALSQSDQMMAYINSLMLKNGEQNKAMYDQLQQRADAQAAAQAKSRTTALNNLITSLKSQQGQQLQGIANGVQDAQAGLEDSSFQKYLAARQGMADRGLAGSGLAANEDTRLLLDKQRNMSGIFRDANLQRDKVNSSLGQQLDQAYTGLSDINPDQISSGIFSELYKTGQTGLMDQAKLYADLFKTTLPYDQATVKDWMGFTNDQNRLGLDTWAAKDKSAQGWAGLNLEQYKAQDGSLLGWAKVGQEDKRIVLEQAKAMIESGKLDLDKWKTYGYMPDPGGSGSLVPTAATSQANRTAALEEAKAQGFFVGPNGEVIPTEQRRSNQAGEYLTGQKLVAQVAQWTEENKLSAGRLNLSEAEFGHKMDYDKATLDRLGEEFVLSKDKVQLDSLKSQLSGIDSQIRSAIAFGGPDSVKPGLTEARDNIVGQIGSLFQSAPKKSGGTGVDSSIFKGWTNIGGSGSVGSSSDGVNPQYKTWITQSGSTAGVKPDVLYKMMMAESSGNPNATSPAGARGLMQFMPDTAKGYGVDSSDPHSSIIGATKYMKDLLNMFGNDYEKAVASYNAGQGTVQRAVQKYGSNWKTALPAETKGYLKKVLGG